MSFQDDLEEALRILTAANMKTCPHKHVSEFWYHYQSLVMRRCLDCGKTISEWEYKEENIVARGYGD